MRGDTLQAPVPSRVSIVVVVPLEVVDVDHRHGKRSTRSLGAMPSRVKHLLQPSPVGHARKGIRCGQLLQALVGESELLCAFGDLALQRRVDESVIKRYGELTRDEHDAVEAVGPEGAADESVLQEQEGAKVATVDDR